MLRSIVFRWVDAPSNIRLMTQNFEKKSWKNEWSQIDPESFQEGSQSSRTSKYMIEQPYKLPWGFRKNFKNSTWNPSFWWLLGLIFLIFLMLTHVLPAAGLEAILKWLVEHILPCSLRVIRRQSGPSLKFQKLRHLGYFGGSNVQIWEIYEKVWLRIFFPI